MTRYILGNAVWPVTLYPLAKKISPEGQP